MTLEIADSSLRRYSKLINSIVSNMTGIAICDHDGGISQSLALQESFAATKVVDNLRRINPDWYRERKVQVLAQKGALESIITVGICGLTFK